MDSPVRPGYHSGRPGILSSPQKMTLTPRQARNPECRCHGFPPLPVCLGAALFNLGFYAPVAQAVWGGQQYIAVPELANATTARTVIKRRYAVARGLPVTDAQGNSYRFGTYVVKDTFYRDAKKNVVKLTRNATVQIQVSGPEVGTISINEKSQYQQEPGAPIRQIRTDQTLIQSLTRGNESGTATQTLHYRLQTPSTPPSYDPVFLLQTGFSFLAGPPTKARLSGSLCLSSQPNQPCPVLPGRVISFKQGLGWKVVGTGQTLTLTAAGRTTEYTAVTEVQQIEPQINLVYTDIGCPASSGSSGCLVPSIRRTEKSTSWIAPGIGVVQYTGPFYIDGASIRYVLKGYTKR